MVAATFRGCNANQCLELRKTEEVFINWLRRAATGKAGAPGEIAMFFYCKYPANAVLVLWVLELRPG